MKILIVSDSHGVSDNVLRAIDKTNPDHFIHLGDIEDDPEEIIKHFSSPILPRIFIKGNCDYGGRESLWKNAVFDLNGHRFYCCHGHSEKVNYGLATLALTCAEERCDIALFGHTHVPFDSSGLAVKNPPYYEEDNFSSFNPGLRILNPGSITLPRGGYPKGYMVMDMEPDGRYRVTYHTL